MCLHLLPSVLPPPLSCHKNWDCPFFITAGLDVVMRKKGRRQKKEFGLSSFPHHLRTNSVSDCYKVKTPLNCGAKESMQCVWPQTTTGFSPSSQLLYFNSLPHPLLPITCGVSRHSPGRQPLIATAVPQHFICTCWLVLEGAGSSLGVVFTRAGLGSWQNRAISPLTNCTQGRKPDTPGG